jgi:tetratricopeptide (TPR) repeat protein
MRSSAVFAFVLSIAAVAAAQGHSPSVWERAADPERAVADRIHREVEALLFTAYYQRDEESGAGQERLNKAMQLLEEGHADRSPDVRLRFDFGHVAELRREEQRAAPVLESALRDAPDHPLAMRAYFELAICLAKLGRTEAEIMAYDEYLRRQTDTQNRALALANRAEAHMTLGRQPHMTLGRLTLAVNDYRAALLIDPGHAQAHWGLSVALDRSGDAPGALAEAKLAITYDPLEQQISGPSAFFVPPYEQYWYEALSAAARAQQLDDAPSSILLWETAAAKWAAYVAVAASDDRWLPLAKAHLASSQRQLDQAKKRLARTPRGHRPRGDDNADP